MFFGLNVVSALVVLYAIQDALKATVKVAEWLHLMRCQHLRAVKKNAGISTRGGSHIRALFIHGVCSVVNYVTQNSEPSS